MHTPSRLGTYTVTVRVVKASGQRVHGGAAAQGTGVGRKGFNIGSFARLSRDLRGLIPFELECAAHESSGSRNRGSMAGESIEATVAEEQANRSVPTGPAGFEISPQQRRIWLFQRHTSALYASVSVEIQGALGVDALKRAVGKLMAKHEILRTNFRRVPGSAVPVQ